MALNGYISGFNERQTSDGLGFFNPLTFVYSHANSVPSVELFENNVLMNTTSFGSAYSSFSSNPFIIGAENVDGTPLNFTPCNVGFVSGGRSMTANQRTKFYQAVSRIMIKWRRM